MKVLIVCSGNFDNPEKNFQVNQSFVYEQAVSLKNNGIDVDYFLIKGRGFGGYIRNYPKMIKKIKAFKPNIVHAHYGLSGMLAVLQRKVPVIVTFHGSDINESGIEKVFSKMAIRLSKFNIFVSTKLAKKAGVKNKYSIVSCGVDMHYAIMLDKTECRKKLGLNIKDKYILFSSSFDNPVKNYKLAQQAVSKIENAKLLQLINYSREEVNLLMNACDLLLITSFNESGPLVVKEAIACGCPVVSTDVGDVKEIIGDINGCYITDFSADEITQKLHLVLNSNNRIDCRDKIYELGLDTDTIANKIINIYNTIP